MGKASSAKKVARAAKAGGKKSGTSRQFAFPLAIIVLMVLGFGLLAYARSSGQLGSDSVNPPRANQDHWHASYGIYICDHFVTNVSDRGPDTLGIHTHDDGLIHIHPFTGGAAGKQAKFARFFDQTGLKVTNSEIKLPAAAPFDGRTYKEGSTTCNGKPAKIEMVHWAKATEAAIGAKPSKVFTSGFSNVKFTEDLGAFTIAFVPAHTKVPPPPGAGQILQNATVDSSPQPTDSSTDTSTPLSLDTGSTAPTSAPATDTP